MNNLYRLEAGVSLNNICQASPAKYGIKIFWLCDSFMPFAIDGIIYFGKQSGEAIQKILNNLKENIVVRPSSGLKQSGNF